MFVRSTRDAFIVSKFKICISWIEPRPWVPRIEINSIHNRFHISSPFWRNVSNPCKATVISIMYFVRLCSQLYQLGFHWPNFHDISYCRILLNSIKKFRVYLKSKEKYHTLLSLFLHNTFNVYIVRRNKYSLTIEKRIHCSGLGSTFNILRFSQRNLYKQGFTDTCVKDNKDPNSTMLLCTCIACLVSDTRNEFVSFSGIPGRPNHGCCFYVCTPLSLSPKFLLQSRDARRI